MQVLEQKCKEIFLATSKTCNFTIYQIENSITFGHVPYPEYIPLPSAGVPKYDSATAPEPLCKQTQLHCCFLLKFESVSCGPDFKVMPEHFSTPETCSHSCTREKRGLYSVVRVAIHKIIYLPGISDNFLLGKEISSLWSKGNCNTGKVMG